MKGEGGSGIFYGYLVVAAAFFIMVAVWAAFYSFGVFFKPIRNEFGWTRAMTSGAFSLSAIIMGVLGIAMGGLNDKLGPRAVMSICGLLLGGGYILMSRVSTLWQLYLFYGVILGAGRCLSWVYCTWLYHRGWLWPMAHRVYIWCYLQLSIGLLGCSVLSFVDLTPNFSSN